LLLSGAWPVRAVEAHERSCSGSIVFVEGDLDRVRRVLVAGRSGDEGGGHGVRRVRRALRSRHRAAKDASLRRAGLPRYNSPVPAAPPWYVYLLRCGDGSLYAGATTDVTARLAAHREGKGARYTRGRGPLLLVLCERHRDRSAALRREHELKRLRRAEKLALLRSKRPVARA